MPFINFKTNSTVSKEDAVTLKTAFGKAITDLGKGENWLMINIEGNKTMFFKGDDSACAIAEIALFGKANNSQYDKMTEDMCDIISDVLNIPTDKIYIKYEEINHWGYSGFNF